MAKLYNDTGMELKYLIVNDKDRSFGLSINTVGYQSIRPNSPYPVRNHPTGYFLMPKKDVSCVNISCFTLRKGKVLLHPMILLTGRWEKGI